MYSEKTEELQPWQTNKVLKPRGERGTPQPTETSIHGKEIHVNKQKQTQKEVWNSIIKDFLSNYS